MPSTGKKRKHDSFSLPTTLTVHPVGDTTYSPIIATTPGIDFPRHAALTVYSRPRPKKKNKPTPALEYIVHGTSEHLDYEGRELFADAENFCHHIGIFDGLTGQLELQPAALVHIRRDVKSFRERDAALATRNTGGESYLAARTALGIEFGTKKSKKALERREINQINVREMDTMVTESIVEQIGENTESMPSKEELESVHEQARLLPPHRIEGLNSPSEVYALDDVISHEEMELLWINEWYDIKKNGGVVQIPNNTHVTHRLSKLHLLRDRNPANIRRLKIFKYITILRNLYMFLTNRKESQSLLLRGREGDIRRHLSISSDLLVILLRKYTESIGGPSAGAGDEKDDYVPSRKTNPMLLTKLLNYLAIMCLLAEDHLQVDVYYLKDDLGLQLKDILQVFANVGCKRKELTPIQLDALGIKKVEARQHRIAYLTAKPEFPKLKMRRMANRKN